MSLEFFLFRKKQVLINFAFFLFCLLVTWSHNRLSVFEEGAIKHISRAKIWLYGFQSVFWQNLSVFRMLSICFSFCNRIKIEYQQFLSPIFRKTGNRKPMG